MKTLKYTGPPENPPDEPVSLDPNPREALDHPGGYLPDPGLIRAADAALTLRQPLLLTGDPGVGKSQFAHALSYALGLGEKAMTFHVKSNTEAKNLFYDFDELARFRDQGKEPLVNYLSFNALGKAILLSGGPDAETAPLPQSKLPAFKFSELAGGGFRNGKPTTSVILLDELDKAPRDLPNDILNEIDQMSFRIPEIGQEVRGDRNHLPIVVITSNSEKNLPDPFLRRCIYYDIPFPLVGDDTQDAGAPNAGGPTLHDIVTKRISGLKADHALVRDAVSIFAELRKPENALHHRPTTSELLNWLLLLINNAELTADSSLRDHPELARFYVSVFVKDPADIETAAAVIADWLTPKNEV